MFIIILLPSFSMCMLKMFLCLKNVQNRKYFGDALNSEVICSQFKNMIPLEWQSRKRLHGPVVIATPGFTFLLLLHISLNFLLKIMLILYHDICTTGYNNTLICRLDNEVISGQMTLLTKLHRHSGMYGRYPVFHGPNLSS